VFDEPVTTMFHDWMYRCAAFCGVDIPEVVMDPCGYKLAAVVNDPANFTDETLLEAYGYLYGPKRKALMQQALDAGGDDAERARRYIRYGVGRIDVFQQILKQGFTARYNYATGHRGTLWQGRYSSILLAEDDAAVRVAAVTLTLMSEERTGGTIPVIEPEESASPTLDGNAASNDNEDASLQSAANSTDSDAGDDSNIQDQSLQSQVEAEDRPAANSSNLQAPAKQEWKPVAYVTDKPQVDGLPRDEKWGRILPSWSAWWRAQSGDSLAIWHLERYFPATDEYTTLERYAATKELVRWMLDHPEGEQQPGVAESLLSVAAGLVMDYFETAQDLRYYSELTRRGYGRALHTQGVLAELVTRRGKQIERGKRAHALGIHIKSGHELHLLLRPRNRPRARTGPSLPSTQMMDGDNSVAGPPLQGTD
jgi:hypothetical protein